MQQLPRLRVFYGPMCSGKTHELLKHAHLLAPAFPALLVLKHALDTRGAAPTTPPAIASRTGLRLPASHCLSALDAAPLAPRALYVLDEAQFFGPSLLPFFEALPATSCLLAAGLDLDFAARPFGATLALAARARSLPGGQGAAAALGARCCAPGCARPAHLTQRLAAGGSATVLVGGAEFYRPACAAHHSRAPVDGAGWREE
jgi:thymidine kinase